MDKELEQINTLDEISEFLSDRQKELEKAIQVREFVENERYTLQKEILELQRQIQDRKIKKIELDKALNKSKCNCMVLMLVIKRSTAKYWGLKNV